MKSFVAKTLLVATALSPVAGDWNIDIPFFYNGVTSIDATSEMQWDGVGHMHMGFYGSGTEDFTGVQYDRIEGDHPAVNWGVLQDVHPLNTATGERADFTVTVGASGTFDPSNGGDGLVWIAQVPNDMITCTVSGNVNAYWEWNDDAEAEWTDYQVDYFEADCSYYDDKPAVEEPTLPEPSPEPSAPTEEPSPEPEPSAPTEEPSPEPEPSAPTEEPITEKETTDDYSDNSYDAAGVSDEPSVAGSAAGQTSAERSVDFDAVLVRRSFGGGMPAPLSDPRVEDDAERVYSAQSNTERATLARTGVENIIPAAGGATVLLLAGLTLIISKREDRD